ncbi:MAG: CHAD domain-containing protein [Verrucomicrobiota bacterium]
MKSPALQFRPDEDLAVALQRLADSQRQEAEKWAKRTDRPAEAVHRIRLVLKFLRALLKLSRRATGTRFYRRENTRLQKAARMLSPWRDATVIGHTIKKVSRKLSAKHRGIIRAALAGQKNCKHPEHKQELRAVMQNAVASIQATTVLLTRLPLKSGGWPAIEQGLQQSYHQVSRSLKRIKPSDTDESFHERRKITKQLFYHITLLEPAWPTRLARLQRRLKKLQDLLGKDHDLAVVRGLLQGAKTDTAKERASLLKNLQRRNRLMRREIRELAGETFSKKQKPGSFIKKVIQHFRVWRQEKPARAKV